MDEEKDYILLKWGTIKGWNIADPSTVALLDKYFADGAPTSAMADRPNEDRKSILCDLIAAHKGDIINDWSGEKYSQQQAIDYVKGYGG